MNGFNIYKDGIILSKGMKVLFKAGEDYYYGIVEQLMEIVLVEILLQD